MSYFDTSSSANSTLTFTSFNSANLQHGHVSGVSPDGNSMHPSQNGYIGSSSNRRSEYGKSRNPERATNFSSTDGPVGLSQRDIINGGEEIDAKGSVVPEVGIGSSSHTKRDRQNKPGQKFGAKKRSWVWSWFIQDQNDQNIAICDFCGKVITRVASDRGSPKKLSEHLHTHKLTKTSMNTSRSLHLDENGIQFNNAQVQVPFRRSFSQQNDSRGANSINSAPPRTHMKVMTSISRPRPAHVPHQESSHNLQLLPETVQDVQLGTDSESIAPELKHNAKKYRRMNDLNDFNHQEHHSFNRSRSLAGSQVTSNVKPSYQNSQKNLPASFESSPYSESKFHRHLLGFLAENKLSIRLLRSHSFQQLIYDLRPDSINDILDFTGLYTSFVEVARADTLSDTLDPREASVAEANVVNTLARELTKK